MSLDVFFFSYLDGKPVPYPIDIVKDALGRFATRTDGKSWALRFPDGGWCDLDLNDAAEFSFFALSPPAFSSELWQGVFEIMKKTRGILVCTGAGSCVTDVSVISRIDFADDVSPVYVVNGPIGIRLRVEEALQGFNPYLNHVQKRLQHP